MVSEIANSQVAAASSKPHANVPSSASTVNPEAQRAVLPPPAAEKTSPVKDGRQQKAATSENITELVGMINDRPQVRERSLQFSVHEGTGIMQVRVYDSKTHELIREIPSEEMLRIAERIDEVLAEDITGIILQDQA
jgi:flagellar protein FlaG